MSLPDTLAMELDEQRRIARAWLRAARSSRDDDLAAVARGRLLELSEIAARNDDTVPDRR